MEEKSFEGIVKVYNEEYYVNTRTGLGLDKVLKKIEPLLNKMASKTYINGYGFEDIKQELAAIAIDGIRSYNPDKNVKLSTFLHIHLNNKIISKLRRENKASKDAFSLHSEDDGNSKISQARGELSFSQCLPEDGNINAFENTLGEESSLYGERMLSYSDIDFTVSIQNLAEFIDEKTLKIINLIYYNDYSIKDAAKEVGLTGWAASTRLKKLSDDSRFREVFSDFLVDGENIQVV